MPSFPPVLRRARSGTRRPNQPDPQRWRRSLRSSLSALAGVLVVVVVVGLIYVVHGEQVNDASHTYPASFLAQLGTNCRNAGGTASYCTCTLDKVQQQYTLGEFRRLAPQVAANVVRQLGVDCAAASHDYGPAFRESFFKDCATTGVSDARCSCMLEHIQQQFTAIEYAALERQLFTTGTAPPPLAQALAPCDAVG